jgi:hypothetical protein
MEQRKELIGMLKKSLKSAGIKYSDIAKHLRLSEISIKRNFAQNNFTLDRLEAICSMIDIDLIDLVRMTDDERVKISTLTLEQEEELVADLKFLLVAICVQNAWQMDEIIHYYDISKAECIRYLIKLDRHGLIHLLPNNRIRRMLAHDFRWIPQGPIETFFENNVQNEFMSSSFTHAGELRIYLIGMLSRNSLNTLRNKIQLLAREYSALQQDDARLSARSRFNTGFMLAIRPWELLVFAKMKRQNQEEFQE